MDNDDMAVRAEAAADFEQQQLIEAHDAQLTAELARAFDPEAWDPELGMADHRLIGQRVGWAARRLFAARAASRALPWVKQQCRAAYQEAVDAQDGAL
jgi:hypothetical protein